MASVVDIYPKELLKSKKEECRTGSITGPSLVDATVPNKHDKKEAMFYTIQSDMKLTQQYPRPYDYYKPSD